MALSRIGHGNRPTEEQRQRMAAFGRRLRVARTAAGLSAADVATLLPREVAVSGGALRAYERGEAMPSEPMVVALETVLLDAHRRTAVREPLEPGEFAALLREPPPVADEEALRSEVVELRQRVAALEALVLELPARDEASRRRAVAQRMDELSKQAGLTPAALSRALPPDVAVSAAMIRAYLSGDRAPSPAVLSAIESVLASRGAALRKGELTGLLSGRPAPAATADGEWAAEGAAELRRIEALVAALQRAAEHGAPHAVAGDHLDTERQIPVE